MSHLTMSRLKGPTLWRPLSVALSTLALLTALTPGRAMAQCTPTVNGVANVTVDYVRDALTDVPVLLGDATDRREHARISTGLALALGIALDVNGDLLDDPQQIRVIVDVAEVPPLEEGTLPNGLRATANFTAIETFDESALELEIYAENPEPLEPFDEDSGHYKLVEENAVDLTDVELTILPLAPSATTTIENNQTNTDQHFCEPEENGTDVFVERVILDADKDFVLVVPHGGEIEGGTSEQIEPLTDVLKQHYSIDANIWETTGGWNPDKLASEHFHITSKALAEAAYPGLDDLMSRPPFATGQPFRYAASLHGFGDYDGNGLVFGGDAHPETKCFVARAIQQRLSDLGLGKIAYYVYDDDGNVMVNLPDERDITIPQERATPVGLTGRSSSNIVNRLAPNPNGTDTDFGGMQIEQSVPLRDDTQVRDLVARQIGHAFGQLIDNLSLVDPASTTQCDALIAGPTPPAGELTGTVWLDDNEDGILAGGELGVAGVTVTLLKVGVPVDSTVTDSAGNYAFTGLTDGEYGIRVTAPPARGFGPRDAGGNDAFDSDVDDTTGQSHDYWIAADGSKNLDLDTALVAIVTVDIGDRAWIDANTDGVQDPGEAGLPGVLVTLLAADGTIAGQATTDATGHYLFQRLPAADYRLRFEGPVGYELTQTGGGSDATDSDPNPLTGETELLPFTEGQVDDTRDAGFIVDCFDVAPVSFGSTWMVSDVHHQDWLDANFPENGWTPGQAIVGYGSSKAITEFIPSDHTAYFRLTFDIDDPSLFDSLDLTLYRDDGAAVYLNGTRVLLSNLPDVPLGPSTPALSNNRSLVTVPVDVSLLESGPNVLAVEVHNREISSPSADLLFDLELSSQVCRPCIDAVTIVADRDTYLKYNDTSPNGDSDEIKIDNSPERSGLIGFPVAGAVPVGAEVLHAELELWITDDSSQPYRFYPLLREWQEAAATYTTPTDRPDDAWQLSGAKGATDRDSDRPVGLIDDLEEKDVLADVVLNVEGRAVIEEWVAVPATNHGLIIPGDEGSTNDLYFAARDSTDPGPALRVVYATSCGG